MMKLTEGQIMSECIYKIIDFPKYHRKNLIDFCPGRFCRLGHRGLKLDGAIGQGKICNSLKSENF